MVDCEIREGGRRGNVGVEELVQKKEEFFGRESAVNK